MAATGYRDYVETVRAAADIVDVVGDSVSLRKSGSALVGLCPFHQEKTPSFRVDVGKGLYYCFGCQAGGDVFSFLKALHGLDFMEAVFMLGDRCGVPRPPPRRSGGRHEPDHRARSLAALAEAQEFFEKELSSAGAATARKHLAARKLSEADIEGFGLGFAPDAWDHQLRHLVSRGFKPEELLEAGLVVAKRKGSGFYDRFRGRITFPIRDAAGRIVSFGGRIVGEGEPKYLNGPESKVYAKSRTLFRLAEVSSEIRSAGRVVIVEGYFDAIGLAARGIPGVVAVCGTSLSPEHVRILSRFTSRVVLAFDADDAGRRAARRALAPLLNESLEVRIAVPDKGFDPEEMARERGAEAIGALIDQAKPVADFLVDEAHRDFELSTVEGRVSALEMILGHLLSLPSAVARAESVSVVADGLHIEDDLVREELRRAARERRTRLSRKAFSSGPVASSRGPLLPIEAELLRYLCESEGSLSQEADAIAEAIPVGAISELARELLDAWRTARSRGESLDHRRLAEGVPERVRSAVWGAAFCEGAPPTTADANECIRVLREQQLRNKLRSVQHEIESTQKAEELSRLTQEKIAVARELDGLRLNMNVPSSEANRAPRAAGEEMRR